MPAAAITTKGQITLPKYIRDKLGVKPGDRIAFRELTDGSILVEAENVDLLDLCGAIKPRIHGVTVEDMKQAVRRRGGKAR